MIRLLPIGAGGFLGAIARYLLSGAAQQLSASVVFPFGTFLVDAPLYEWIVLRAREAGLAGATVLRGTMGFGAHSRVHTFKIERLSEDMPVVIEIVDTREKIESFLQTIDPVIGEGMATLVKVDIRFYRSGTRRETA